ncbi:MAG: helix-turn-helix transcriptional regulator, partial [Clostridia bacterium]|nr:helix-turn-helix transcriptional regulator [Clostridia bacterium]
MLPNVKLLRREAGISQQALADALGISQQSINHYENHDTQPDLQTLKQMADYFNTSIDYIVGHTDIKDPFDNTEAFHLNADEGELITQY